jgi:nucleotide-binding universal stress UspA family protein
MSDPPRRVLIALDSSIDSLRALDEAAEMAARINAELVGIFVEDTNLLNLASLPCASEVGSATGFSRSLNASVVGRTLKSIAERARLAMAQAAEQRQVRWSFTTSRGTLLGQLIDASNPEGTVLAGSSRGGWRVASKPARSVLLLHMGPCTQPEGTAVILIDAGFAALRNLPTALALADQSCTKRTLVVILSDSLIEARRQRERVAGVLESEDVPSEIRTLAPLDAEALRSFLENVVCGALVLGGAGVFPGSTDFAALVENTRFPVFVIR